MFREGCGDKDGLTGEKIVSATLITDAVGGEDRDFDLLMQNANANEWEASEKKDYPARTRKSPQGVVPPPPEG